MSTVSFDCPCCLNLTSHILFGPIDFCSRNSAMETTSSHHEQVFMVSLDFSSKKLLMSFFAKGSKLFQDMVSQLQTTGTADLCECYERNC